MSLSDDFEADLNDPVLKKDIELAKDKLDFLEANKEKCFLCKWMLEDYRKNGTFTGYKVEGALGAYEMFPIRGEVNHLWLELFQKPYPFKKKVGPSESKILKGPPPQVTKPVVAAPAPAPAPAQDPSLGSRQIAKPKR